MWPDVDIKDHKSEEGLHVERPEAVSATCYKYKYKYKNKYKYKYKYKHTGTDNITKK